MKKLERIGEIHKTNNFGYLTIIGYDGSNNTTVIFDDGTIIEKIRYSEILNKKVRNPNKPFAYGIGYTGIGKHKVYIDGVLTKEYGMWHSMLTRCYNTNQRIRYKTYNGCTVAKEWHNFQNFAQWYNENKESHREAFHLDKDILIKGNKLYSPETCCFVPNEINQLFTKRLRNKFCIGVKKAGKFRFRAEININRIKAYLGTFDTMVEAFQAYKIAKELEIKRVADKWRGQITEQVYQALINYQVEITD